MRLSRDQLKAIAIVTAVIAVAIYQFLEELDHPGMTRKAIGR